MANEPNEDEPLFHAATYTQAPKVSHKVLTKEERQVLIKQHEEKQQEAAKLDQVASKGPVGRWWSRLQSGPNRITPAMAIVALGVVYGDIGTSPLYTMQTFLNAMTYPDKTIYPVATTNEQDLYNLMDVYLDAVFNPAIYTKPTIFEQEGWHYELDLPEGAGGDGSAASLREGTLRYNGVVFNEMKGALSDPMSVLDDAVSCIDLIAPEGTVAYAEDKNGERTVLGSSDDESKIDLPMVCLVNSNTASAAELFAASLRSMNGARLVGTTTMGKGTIQSSPQRLSDGSAVRRRHQL